MLIRFNVLISGFILGPLIHSTSDLVNIIDKCIFSGPSPTQNTFINSIMGRRFKQQKDTDHIIMQSVNTGKSVVKKYKISIWHI